MSGRGTYSLMICDHCQIAITVTGENACEQFNIEHNHTPGVKP